MRDYLLPILVLYLLAGYLTGAVCSPAISMDPTQTRWLQTDPYVWMVGWLPMMLIKGCVWLCVGTVIAVLTLYLRRFSQAFDRHFG